MRPWCVRAARLTVFAGGLSHRLELKEFETVADEEAGGSLTAPMPGSVIDVLVERRAEEWKRGSR